MISENTTIIKVIQPIPIDTKSTFNVFGIKRKDDMIPNNHDNIYHQFRYQQLYKHTK